MINIKENISLAQYTNLKVGGAEAAEIWTCKVFEYMI